MYHKQNVAAFFMKTDRKPTIFIYLFSEDGDHVTRIANASIEGDNLAPKFIESLKSLLPDKNAVERILATREVVDLFSTMENTNLFTSVVRMKKIDATTFKIWSVKGRVRCTSADEEDLSRPILFHEAEFKANVYQKAAVFDLSDTFLNNFITNFGYEDDGHLTGSQTFLNTLVMTNRVKVLRTLLDNVEDMNLKLNSGSNVPTPFQLACLRGNVEIVAMFMYYNVDPNEPAVTDNGNTYHRHPPIYYAANYDRDTIIAMLMDYTFDECSPFDFDFFLQLVFNHSPNLQRVAEFLHECAFTIPSFCVSASSFCRLWTRLFTMRKFQLELGLAFLRSSRTGCQALLQGFKQVHWEWYWTCDNIDNDIDRAIFFENLYHLGSEDALCPGFYDDPTLPEPTLLQLMLDTLEAPLRVVTMTCITLGWSVDVATTLIMLLLSNNCPMDDSAFDNILKFCMLRRDYTLWDAVRHLEVDCSAALQQRFVYGNIQARLMTNLYHRFCPGQTTILEMVRNPADIHDSDVAYYVGMSSHPVIKNRALSMAERMGKRFYVLNEFPTLLEFARDAARIYVVRKYKIKSSLQFHRAVQKLEVFEYLKKLIEYDVREPLYIFK